MYVCTYVCMCVGEEKHMCHSTHGEVTGQLVGASLSFYRGTPRNQIHAFRLGARAFTYWPPYYFLIIWD